jgi:DNA-binding helix-hairpin-helix protein with protein kinase domain
MSSFKTESGYELQLGARIGAGGQGCVFTIAGTNSTVVKISNSELPSSYVSKLRYMMANKPDLQPRRDGQPAVAWPEELVRRNDTGLRVGFTMAYVSGQTWGEYCRPTRRHVKKPFHRHCVIAAYNLSAVLNSVHRKGYVVGDLNRGNVLVNDTGGVSIIDTDSFQVDDGTNIHLCPVGHPEYTAPELSFKRLGETRRTSSQDRFALAVMIYQMLLGGYHPFSVGFRDAQKSVPEIAEAIRKGWTAIDATSGSGEIRSPNGAPTIEFIPSVLRSLMVRAFRVGYYLPEERPTGQEWMDALRGILENPNAFGDCPAEPRKHLWFSDVADDCPWCRVHPPMGR